MRLDGLFDPTRESLEKRNSCQDGEKNWAVYVRFPVGYAQEYFNEKHQYPAYSGVGIVINAKTKEVITFIGDN
ncbi:TPA: hypothetical protein HA241_06685 [Candidatus Woesearchaeota archaeon]|nr:hypothetical protein [Candidatus Woesearchaeota archaeon]